MMFGRSRRREEVGPSPSLNNTKKCLNNYYHPTGYAGHVAELGFVNRDKWVKHYSCFHQILLVGDGDFSFSLSLALAFGSAFNICATSLDSPEDLVKKYRQVGSNLKQLRRLGATILHEVDATKMVHCSQLKYRKFDRIIFNFPHAGFYGKEENPLLIEMHQELVHGFFSNARWLLHQNGEVHVSHKDLPIYRAWNLEELASKSGLQLVERVPFNKEDYPHYQNKRGQGRDCDASFELGECSTYKFIVPSDSADMLNCSPNQILSTDVPVYETTPNLIRRGSFIPTEVCPFSPWHKKELERLSQMPHNRLRFIAKGMVDLYTGQATYTGALVDSGTMIAFISGPLYESPRDSDVAELIAIRNALLMFERSKLCGKATVVVESDSNFAVSWVKSKYGNPLGVVPHVQEINMALARIRGADICCSIVMDGVESHRLVVHELEMLGYDFKNEVEFWF